MNCLILDGKLYIHHRGFHLTPPTGGIDYENRFDGDDGDEREFDGDDGGFDGDDGHRPDICGSRHFAKL